MMEHATSLIKAVPDFPKPGILFRDITPALADFHAMQDILLGFDRAVVGIGGTVQKVAGIEARGFILAPIVALSCGAGFVPIRKAGKLPRETFKAEVALEYGTATLEIHKDAVGLGERVVIIDDVLATGGTALSAARLVEECGGVVSGIIFMVEIGALNGREKLKEYHVDSLIKF